jgi:hypothetical protein
MPLTNRDEAKEGGWKQVREAVQVFEGDVVKAEFGQWGGQLIDDAGKPVPPKEFLEVACVSVNVIEVMGEMSFIPTEFGFRVNCSDFKNSFWVEDFLLSADKAKLLIPDDMIGKRIRFKKASRVGSDPKYTSTNFIIDAVLGASGSAPIATTPAPSPVPATTGADPMVELLELAVGKTEAQFRSAVSLNPAFANSPFLALVKAGAITASLIKEGKLKIVKDGSKEVYQKP